MIILEIIKAVITLGLPTAVISWLIFSWLYQENVLDISADRKTTAANLKTVNKAFKNSKGKKPNYFYKKWLKFGGGFYGLVTLWTLIVVELIELFNFIFAFPGFEALFKDGVLALLIKAILNQISNLATAFTWFSYWSDSSVLISVAAAYFGYLMGIQMAKRTQNKEITS